MNCFSSLPPNQATEEVSKNLVAMKEILYGTNEKEPQTEAVAQLAQELYNSGLLSTLVADLQLIDFEVRNQFLIFQKQYLIHDPFFLVFCPLKHPKIPVKLLAQGLLTCKRARAARLISRAGQELRGAPGLGQVSLLLHHIPYEAS